MTTSSDIWVAEIVEAAGTRLHLVKGGTGETLLILHDETGYPGGVSAEPLPKTTLSTYQATLGSGSRRVEWIMNIRDLAGWHLDALDDLGLGPVKVVSFFWVHGWPPRSQAAAPVYSRFFTHAQCPP